MSLSLIALIRDHSGSMRPIAKAAARDYNATIASVRAASEATGQDTAVSVLELGYGSTSQVRCIIDCQPVGALTPIPETSYSTSGGTPLWDAVGAAIDNLRRHPRASDPDTAFLVSLTTDGQEMHSQRHTASSIQRLMNELIATDRWTFIFRVPRGDVKGLIRLGIPEGNILPWDQTSQGVAAAQAVTTQAFTDYMSGRASGMKSTTKFFANMAEVTLEDVKAVCTNIGSEVTLLPVGLPDHDTQIRDFVEGRLGTKMLKGAAFYQLTKTEPKVQDYKVIAVQNKQTGEVYAGPAARQMAGLPQYGDCRVAPDDLGEWNVFIQSTSVNRKVVAGTTLLYWPNVGKAFTEGKSA